MLSATGALASVILWLTTAAEEVKTLTAANFDQHLQDTKFVLAEFYAPWCGHCKKLAPEYEKAAAALKNDGVSLAKVDATEEKDLAKRFEVKGFPTLIWFENQKRGEYTGGRTTQTIVDWVRSMTGPAVIETSSPDPPADKPYLVLKDSTLHAVYEQVAKDNRRKATFYYQKTNGPTVLVLTHSGEETIKYTGSMENASLSNFLFDNAMPLFGELNGDTFDRYLEAGKGLVWALFPMKADSNMADIQKANRPMMLEVAKKLRGKYFVTYTDTEKFKDAVDSMLGVSQFPAIAVQKKSGDKKKYVYTGEMTADKIHGFISDVDAGKVAPSFKSQPEPTGTEDVKVVVANTLKKEVFQKDRDVLLEVYAPWCGHCKKLEPEYTKLAKKIRKEELGDLVTIAKLDGTANDSPVDELDWTSFPTIFFVKAGGNATVYDGERTAKGLWKYIRKHATKAQEIRERLDRRKGSKKGTDRKSVV